MPTVSIGMTPRDHFSDMAEAVRLIFLNTSLPFTLYIVDCGMPERYRRAVERETAGHANVFWLRAHHFLYPNQSRNLVLAASKDEYVCFTENDNFVQPGWLEKLLAACERHGAAVATPMLLDGPAWMGSYHFHHDRGLSEIIAHDENGVVAHEVHTDPLSVRRRRFWKQSGLVTTIELHFFLIRRDAFETVGMFDERLSTDEENDLSIALFHHKIPVVYEPAVRVTYRPAPWIRSDERPFYLFRWGVEAAAKSDAVVREKWNAKSLPNTVNFVRGQRYRMNPIVWFFYRALRFPKFLRTEIRNRRALTRAGRP
ncbi:glycosyltransferase [bacterium]|nr:glycosyltransferase [bacterium]